VPAQVITVQPGDVWSREYLVSEPQDSLYKAVLFADVGNFQTEEDETNNVARATFAFTTPPK
jgi:subtilase family serine protease